MFTGLVESVGDVVDARRTGGGVRIRIATALAPELTLGESLAVERRDRQRDCPPNVVRKILLEVIDLDRQVNFATGSEIGVKASRNGDDRHDRASLNQSLGFRRVGPGDDEGVSPLHRIDELLS